MPDKFDMSDYVPVNERIEAFYTAWPTGTLQSEIVELTESRVTVKAYAYRAADDERPGIGHSSVVIPGSTPYTRGSEIENAETSAWGRAIAALGFEVKRGIASSEEIRNKQPGQGAQATRRTSPVPSSETAGAAPAPASTQTFNTRGEIQAAIAKAAVDRGLTFAHLEEQAQELGIKRGDASIDQLLVLLVAIERGDEQAAEVPPAAAEPEAGEVAPLAPAVTPGPKNRTVEEAIADAKKKAAAAA